MFCKKCDVHMSMHNDEDDCEGAERRAKALESLERMFFGITRG